MDNQIFLNWSRLPEPPITATIDPFDGDVLGNFGISHLREGRYAGCLTDKLKDCSKRVQILDVGYVNGKPVFELEWVYGFKQYCNWFTGEKEYRDSYGRYRYGYTDISFILKKDGELIGEYKGIVSAKNKAKKLLNLS